MSSELDRRRRAPAAHGGAAGAGCSGLADAGLAELDAEVDPAAGRGLRELELHTARGALAVLLHDVGPAGREDDRVEAQVAGGVAADEDGARAGCLVGEDGRAVGQLNDPLSGV